MVNTFYTFLTALLLGMIYFMVKAWIKSEITKHKEADDLHAIEIQDEHDDYDRDDHLFLVGPEQIN